MSLTVAYGITIIRTHKAHKDNNLKEPIRKPILFPTDLHKQIQDYANKELEGNFSSAIRLFARAGLGNAEANKLAVQADKTNKED